MAIPDNHRRRADTRLGSTLSGRWRLDSIIGAGGMAVVYAATHRNGSRVAIKMLMSEDPEIAGRFRREGLVANTVGHAGAVRVHDDDITEDGFPFLVMELLEGDPLDVVLKRRGDRLPAEEVLRISEVLLDVLAAAHARGIIHRDIKPQNLFITRSGTLKVLDFGIARLHQGRDPGHATRTGVILGTVAYMAPEQASAHHERVDPRTDLWSVGATMFRMLAGRVVHVADSDIARLAAVVTQPAPSIASVVPDLPAPIVEVVDRALAFAPESRWPDASAMQRAVREALASMGHGPHSEGRAGRNDAEPLPNPSESGFSSIRAIAQLQRPSTPGTGRSVASVAISHSGVPTDAARRRVPLVLWVLAAATALVITPALVIGRSSGVQPAIAQRGVRARVPRVLLVEQAPPEPVAAPVDSIPAATRAVRPPPRPVRPRPLDRYP